MKQKYKVHYNNKLTANQSSDLIEIEVEEVEKSPYCEIDANLTFIQLR